MRPVSRQNQSPGVSAGVTVAVDPVTSIERVTVAHARSAQTSTRAPSVPAGSAQRRTGERDVTLDIESGARGLGGAIATHAAPTRKYPILHVKSHVVPSHVETALAGGTHGVQLAPQEPVLASLTQPSPQRWVPLTHENVHAPAVHAGTPLAGAVHSAQLVPHVVTLSSGTQAPAHRLKPALQTKPHAPAVQVAVAPGGAAHGAQLAPQVAGESSLAQVLPQAW